MSKKNSNRKVDKEEIRIIKIEDKQLKFLDKYSELDLLMALTIALSSKLILSKDAQKAIGHMATSKKTMRDALSLSEAFLKFVKKSFSRNSLE